MAATNPVPLIFTTLTQFADEEKVKNYLIRALQREIGAGFSTIGVKDDPEEKQYKVWLTVEEIR